MELFANLLLFPRLLFFEYIVHGDIAFMAAHWYLTVLYSSYYIASLFLGVRTFGIFALAEGSTEFSEGFGKR